jgi:hypothetical protein
MQPISCARNNWGLLPINTKGFSVSPGVDGKGLALELPEFYEPLPEPGARCVFAQEVVRIVEDGKAANYHLAAGVLFTALWLVHRVAELEYKPRDI